MEYADTKYSKYKLTEFKDEKGETYYAYVDTTTSKPFEEKFYPEKEKDPDSLSLYKFVPISHAWWNGEVFINNQTGMPSARVFEQCMTPASIPGLAFVFIDKKQYLYDPENDHVFPSAVDEKAHPLDRVKSVLQEHPEEFGNLPTTCFRDSNFMHNCLDAVKDGVKGFYSDESITVEQLKLKTTTISELVHKKIEQEKENIRLQDSEEARRQKALDDQKAKKDLVDDFSRKIDNFGRNF